MENEKRKCPMCGGNLTNQGEEKLCDVHLKYRYDAKAIIRYFKCEKCGRDYEVLDPAAEERNGNYRDYWIDQNSR